MIKYSITIDQLDFLENLIIDNHNDQYEELFNTIRLQEIKDLRK